MEDRQVRQLDAIERDGHVVDEVHGGAGADRDLLLGPQLESARSLRLEQNGRPRTRVEGKAQRRTAVDANCNEQMTVVPLERNGHALARPTPDVLRLGVALLQVLQGGARAWASERCHDERAEKARCRTERVHLFSC